MPCPDCDGQRDLLYLAMRAVTATQDLASHHEACPVCQTNGDCAAHEQLAADELGYRHAVLCPENIALTPYRERLARFDRLLDDGHSLAQVCHLRFEHSHQPDEIQARNLAGRVLAGHRHLYGEHP